ncbi:MAG: hypothetical protein MJ230_04165 [bacterium]|nr:hypothetical protein [bacterium]
MPDSSISPIKYCGIPQQDARGLSEDKPVNSIMDNLNTNSEIKQYYTEAELIKLLKRELGIDENNKIDLNTIIIAFTNYKNADEILRLNNDEIKNIVAKIARDYKTAINTGWSLEGIASRQQNGDKKGLSERLADFNSEIGEKGFANVSPKKQKEAIKAFFFVFFNDENNKDKSHDKIVKLQMQTFGRILINSSEEEKVAFKEVVKNLLSENISQGLKEVLESLDLEADKTAFANSFTAKDIIEISETEDYYGNTPTNNDLKGITATVTSYKDKRHIKTTHKALNKITTKFIEQNKNALNDINTKISKGEELTDEEQQLLDELNRKKAISSGEMVGVPNNMEITAEDKKYLLGLMNEDNYNHGEDYYRDVIEGIKSYVDEHGDELNITIDEFNVILDKATNNNYSILSGDINAPISPPDSSSPRETNINNGGLGFTIGDKPNVNPDPTVYYPQEDSLPIIVVPNSKTANDVGDKNYKRELLNSDNPEELNNYIKKVGLIGFIEFCMKNAKKGSNAFNMAIKYFKNMSSAMKTVVISFMQDTSSIIELAKTMSLEELKQIKRGPNIYATKMLEMFKEMKEKQLY